MTHFLFFFFSVSGADPGTGWEDVKRNSSLYIKNRLKHQERLSVFVSLLSSRSWDATGNRGAFATVYSM